MDTRSPLLRWREIVHPLFWLVFLWNLRKFARFMRAHIEVSGNGLVGYEITWWGAIHIFRLIDPDAPIWDDRLQGCADRVHLATLDVLNPHLTRLSLLAGGGARGRGTCLSRLMAVSVEAPRPLTPNSSPAGEGDAFVGVFPNLRHLNTS